MMTEQKINTRALVLDMLMEITAGRGYSHIVIRSVLEKYNYLDVQEKAFIKRLTEGTLERMLQIDYCIDMVSKVPVKKMKPLIRNLLRMSVYQLLFMDMVPDSAVCNEAVKLAEKRKFGQLKGFVNGVLRSIARQKEDIRYPDEKQAPAAFLSVFYSMPLWIVELWLTEYGAERTKIILKALLEEHPVTVRLEENLPETEKEAVLNKLRTVCSEMEPHPYLPYAFVLKGVEGMNGLTAFREGKLYVQDVGFMFAVECAGIQKGDRVLDICAAPGGKALHAASKLILAGGGIVEARDVSEDKAALIEENRKRMGLDNIVVKVQDATAYDGASEETADVLLADIPCSGLGVIGKKRDIKYNVKPENMKELLELQKKILSNAARYVKRGGTMIFSTCTIHREENEGLLEWFLEQFPFELQSLDDCLPMELQNETTQKGYIQLLPGIHKTDGGFLAKLKRV